MAEPMSTEKIVRARYAPSHAIVIDIDGEGVVRAVWSNTVETTHVLVRRLYRNEYDCPEVFGNRPGQVDDLWSEYLAIFPECHRCHEVLPDPRSRIYSETDDDVCWCVGCADIEGEKAEAAERARRDDLDPDDDVGHFEAAREKAGE